MSVVLCVCGKNRHVSVCMVVRIVVLFTTVFLNIHLNNVNVNCTNNLKIILLDLNVKVFPKRVP